MRSKYPIKTDRASAPISRGLSLATLLKITYSCIILAVLFSAAKFMLLGERYQALFSNDTFQAVTLTNGQTFFGQLDKYGPKTYVLTNVYYLQREDAATLNETESASDVQLARLIDDLHQPLNYIVLNRDHIVSWQSLSPDSPIVAAIEKGNK